MRQVPLAEARRMHWPILEPIEGPRDRAVALNKEICVAGDRARVNLPLPDPSVSRAHAIFLKNGHVLVRDLASLNHLFVNEQPVREAALKDGDTLRIGPYMFRCEGDFSHADGDDQPAPSAELVARGADLRIAITGQTTLLGTREGCDVILSDETASPAHAVIFEHAAKRFIRDLRSRAGTFVNDKRVGQAELKFGDVLRLANVELVYDAAQVPAAEAPAEKSAEPPQTGETVPLAEAEPSPQTEPQKSPDDQKAAPAGDLDMIPLLDEPAQRSSSAVNAAPVRAGRQAEPQKQDAVPQHDEEEEGIIPLLDEPPVQSPASAQKSSPDDVDFTDLDDLAPVLTLQDEQDQSAASPGESMSESLSESAVQPAAKQKPALHPGQAQAKRSSGAQPARKSDSRQAARAPGR